MGENGTRDDEWHGRLVARYERTLTHIADDLRHLAEQVERHRTPGRSFVHEASWAIQDVMNALPNLGLSVLLDAAKDVDENPPTAVGDPTGGDA
jgi:hypothetical protein